VIREIAVGLPVRSWSASGVALLQGGLADIAALLFPGLAMNAISDIGLRDGRSDLRDYQRLAGASAYRVHGARQERNLLRREIFADERD
jgi:hypothetical protein